MRFELWFVCLLLPTMPAWAQMSALSDEDMRSQAGQGGMYLTGEFSINKNGGVLWGTPTSNDPVTWAANQRSCATKGAATPQSCGMRVSIRAQATGGWYVLDNLKGTFSFEGLTVKTETISSGFGNDGASFNREVLSLGLPSEIQIKEASAAIAISNKDNWRNNQIGAAGADTTFRQSNLISVEFSGALKTQGNLIVFPRP